MKPFEAILSAPLALHRPRLQELLTFALRTADNASDAAGSPDDRRHASGPVYNDSPPEDFIVDGNIAVVPVHGVLAKRGYWWSSRLTTDRLSTLVDVLADRVDHLVLDFDTPGGQVGGTQRFAESIFRARSRCNVVSVVNETALSGGLWTSLAGSRVVIASVGEIGSLGVFGIHVDSTKLMEDIGIKETVIFAGKYKAIHERTLTKDLKDHEQRLIDGIYSEFIDEVARFRGVTPAHVLDNWADARVFLGKDAVSNGLADEVGTLSDVLDELKSGRSAQVSVPSTIEDEGNDVSIKLNPETGSITADGKQIGHLSELSLTADDLKKHCSGAVLVIVSAEADRLKAEHTTALQTAVAEATKTASSEAVKNVEALAGQFASATASALLPVIKGEKTAEAFRAEAAEARAAAAEKALEEAKKAPAAAGTGAPNFAASDKGNAGDGSDAGNNAGDKLAAAWAKNEGNCQADFRNVEEYKAYMTAVERGYAR